jgi:hypothetical protein
VLSPWQGHGILCACTALLLAAAFYLLRRCDTEGRGARAGYRLGVPRRPAAEAAARAVGGGR